ncbi:helix-turn-helix domain-containing protein [Dermatophilus congolensis]|uniref:helix-turn-helix domain-containing protein n=1 Tax=Dermatophilus congolensis TaxID=1863 RepID=UPI001AAFC56B|nr:helix-turn-helix domain-containing protein [Dermatophilus congolensis]MBO3146373.1 helix-turn-helix domain-containing protein [Dermatophilus congolensis]MBO3148584.1 helix-turn-helix domain-containing protein [Dermatophilus congolensis]MBO3157565.1 helix-turn-helix domain-containing protein [Dermatophilus congolensis]MBO3159902.1 helix-turn-helix domain-containing protein [Dermatophilus congolensis]MBO3166641.1 helix-turn-helix domain-containing protein [Dermatophilus congolensis]
MFYVIETEMRRSMDTLTDSEVDDLMDAVQPSHGALSRCDSGNVRITVTIPGEDIHQALMLALPTLSKHGEILDVHALPEGVRDARLGWEPLPEVIGVPEASTILGVSRQQVLNLIKDGKLPATKVGREYALTPATVDAYATQRAQRKKTPGK